MHLIFIDMIFMLLTMLLTMLLLTKDIITSLHYIKAPKVWIDLTSSICTLKVAL